MAKLPAVALLALLALPACDNPASGPFAESEPEITRADFDSDVDYANMMMGRSRASLQDFVEWSLAQWTETVEEHARRWDGERCDEWPLAGSR